MAKYSSKKKLPTYAKNNANVEVSSEKFQTTLDDAMTMHSLASNFDSKIGYVKVNVTYGSHISFVPVADLHLGTSEPKILDKVDNYLKNTITNVIHNGDILQVAVEGHHNGEMHESALSPNQEQLILRERIKPYSDKIVVATGGNHDDPEKADRLKSSYLSAIEPIYNGLGIPYFPNACMVEFVVPIVAKGKVIDKTSLWCAVLHCGGKASGKKLGSAQKTLEQGMGIVQKFNREHFGLNKQDYIYPDFILGGHFHANSGAEYSFEKTMYDKSGRATGTYIHTIRVRSSSTLQNNNSSSFNRGFSDLIVPNLTQFDIHFEINPSYTGGTFNKQPKYIPVVTEFPILNFAGEYSIPAKKYMQTRCDKDFFEELKSQYKNKSLNEVVDEFIVGGM